MSWIVPAIGSKRGSTGSPITKGELLQALGDTYYGLGLYHRAVDLHRRPGASRAIAGSDHPGYALEPRPPRQRLLVCRAVLGGGRVPRGDAEAEGSRPWTRTPGHACHSHNLAVAYRNALGPPRRSRFRRRTSACGKLCWVPTIPTRCLSCNNLANSYKDARAAVRGDRAPRGEPQASGKATRPDHLDTLHSRNNVGVAYRDAGRISEAIAMFETTFILPWRSSAPSHPHTLFSRPRSRRRLLVRRPLLRGHRDA